MKNDSTGFSLQDVFFLIGMQARTGELVIEAGNNIGTMLFHKGKILHAFSPYSRAIGDLLVEEDLMSETDLIEMLMIQKKSVDLPLGGLLIQKGKVTFEVIEMMVHEQIRQAVKEFQSWQGLNFSFVNKEMLPYDKIHLTVYEFIQQDILKSAEAFLSDQALPRSESPTIDSTPVA